jgi:deoxyribonuclease V
MARISGWPSKPGELAALQEELGASTPDRWRPTGPLKVGGCYICFSDDGAPSVGDPAWAAAVLVLGGHPRAGTVIQGTAPAAYQPTFLALREGPLLEEAVSALPEPPDVLLVNATGRDHPRRGGLALHLGAVLGLSSVGVTDRSLVASGEEPAEEAGSLSPLAIEGETVGYWVRTREGVRPVAAHAGWRTDARTAAEVVIASAVRARTPEPVRQARRMARRARSTS